MFRELEIQDRFSAARACGFTAVEFLHPQAWPIIEVKSWLTEASLELILINTPPGDGETGLACLAGREEEFRRLFTDTLTYASELGAGMIHLLAGRASGADAESLFTENVRWAADLAARHGIRIMLEPLNTRDVPGYLHTHCDHTARLIERIDRANVQMQFDFYHSQIMGGDLAASIERHLHLIGHIQFSSLPGRHEPQYGEVNAHWLFDTIDRLGYPGWIGCEYVARGDTRAGLSWGKAFGLG